MVISLQQVLPTTFVHITIIFKCSSLIDNPEHLRIAKNKEHIPLSGSMLL